MQKSPTISIIIPTKNSAMTLPRLLQSIIDERHLSLEIIVVDDLSSDKTVDIAKNYGAQVIAKRSSMTMARNAGNREAKGKYLLSLDSDMSIEPGLLRECEGIIENEGVDAIIIPEINIGEGYWSSCLYLEKLFSIGEINLESSRFFLKSALDSVGDYDENLIAGEDADIQRRLVSSGFRIGRSKRKIHHHLGKLTLKQIAKKYRFYGKTVSTYRKKYNYKSGSNIGMYIRKKNILIYHPIETPGYLFLRLVEFVSYKQ